MRVEWDVEANAWKLRLPDEEVTAGWSEFVRNGLFEIRVLVID